MNVRRRCKRRTVERERATRAWGRGLERAWHDHYRPRQIERERREATFLEVLHAQAELLAAELTEQLGAPGVRAGFDLRDVAEPLA